MNFSAAAVDFVPICSEDHRGMLKKLLQTWNVRRRITFMVGMAPRDARSSHFISFRASRPFHVSSNKGRAMNFESNPYSAPEADLYSPVKPSAFVVASKGRRFGTFIVDYISYLCLSVAIGVGIALVFGQEGIDALERVPNLIVGMAIITAYYVFFEAIWGRTPGKFLMGTVVVTEHGEKPSFGQIIGRTLCRFIPFEPLSCLGERGWHDSIPKVLVVNARGR